MSPVCLYCGSLDTEDCGDVGGGVHHVECRSCHCGFPWETLSGAESDEEREIVDRVAEVVINDPDFLARLEAMHAGDEAAQP